MALLKYFKVSKRSDNTYLPDVNGPLHGHRNAQFCECCCQFKYRQSDGDTRVEARYWQATW